MKTRLLLTLIFTFVLSLITTDIQAKGPKKAEVSVAIDNDCDDLLINNIKKAKKTIYGAVYTFTNKDIAEALISCAKKKVKVKLKLDKEQAKFTYTVTLIKRMKKAGIEIELISMKALGDHMHHKFAVIDKEMVLTGSFNWTRNASTDNNENIISIKSKDIAEEFLAAWKKVGEEVGK